MKDNNITELLEKVWSLREQYNGIFMMYHKPKSKKEWVTFDTDYASFDIQEDQIEFEFFDGSYKDFVIKISDIKDIRFDLVREDEHALSLIYLKNGNTLLISHLN